MEVVRHIRIKTKGIERGYRSRGGGMRNDGQPTYCGQPGTSQDTDRRTFEHVSKTPHVPCFASLIAETCPACVRALS